MRGNDLSWAEGRERMRKGKREKEKREKGKEESK